MIRKPVWGRRQLFSQGLPFSLPWFLGDVCVTVSGSLPGMCPCSSFPNTPGKKFKLLTTLMVSVVWGGLPRVTSSGGCLKISRGGLKTTRGLQDAFALSCSREGWGPAHSHLSSGYLQPELPLKVNPHLGTGCCQPHGVLKWKTCASYMKASWFLTSSHALWEGLIFLALGTGIIASSKKESLKCTFSRRFWKGS